MGLGGRAGYPIVIYQNEPFGHFTTDCMCLLSILIFVVWEKSILRYHIVFSEPRIELVEGNGVGGKGWVPHSYISKWTLWSLYNRLHVFAVHFNFCCVRKVYLEFQFSPKCCQTPSLPPILNGLKIADFPETLDHIPNHANSLVRGSCNPKILISNRLRWNPRTPASKGASSPNPNFQWPVLLFTSISHLISKTPIFPWNPRIPKGCLGTNKNLWLGGGEFVEGVLIT